MKGLIVGMDGADEPERALSTVLIRFLVCLLELGNVPLIDYEIYDHLLAE